MSAEEADGDHDKPARCRPESPKHVSQRLEQAELFKPTINWMPRASVFLLITILLLGMDLDDLIGSDILCKRDDSEGRGCSRLVLGGFGDQKVPDLGDARGPRCAEELLDVAIDLTKFRT